MEVKATTKYVRISPLKARDVAREIQGMPVSKALDVLTFTPRKAAYLVGKTLRSAIANAENNHDMPVDRLVIKEAVIGQGPTLSRYKPRARGSAGPIKKRTSHIFITLTDKIELPAPKKTSGINRKKKIQKRLAFFGSGPKKKAVKKEAASQEEAAEAAAEDEVVEEAAPAISDTEVEALAAAAEGEAQEAGDAATAAEEGEAKE